MSQRSLVNFSRKRKSWLTSSKAPAFDTAPIGITLKEGSGGYGAASTGKDQHHRATCNT